MSGWKSLIQGKSGRGNQVKLITYHGNPSVFEFFLRVGTDGEDVMSSVSHPYHSEEEGRTPGGGTRSSAAISLNFDDFREFFFFCGKHKFA